MTDTIDNPDLNGQLIDKITTLISDKKVILNHEQLDDLANIASKFINRPIPYSQITQLIYETERIDNDGVSAFIEYLRPYLVENNLLSDSNPLAKIYEHISLANTQIKYLLNDKKISTLETTVKYVSENVDTYVTRIDDRINSVYSGFVSVLGIFITISFTLFGGVSLLSTLFSNIKSASNPSTIGSAIVVAGIATLLIYLLSFTLLNGVQRLANRFNIASNRWNRYTEIQQEDLRYRNLFIVLSIGIGIIIFGAKYGKTWPIIFGVQLNYFTVMVPYAIVCLIILKHGVLIRRLVTNFYGRWGQTYSFQRTSAAVKRRIGFIEKMEIIIGIPSLIILIYSLSI